MAGRFGPNVLVSLVLLLLDLGAFFILVGSSCRLNLYTLLFQPVPPRHRMQRLSEGGLPNWSYANAAWCRVSVAAQWLDHCPSAEFNVWRPDLRRLDSDHCPTPLHLL